MPLEVRAFLRYGAIGFKKWWMKPEVREHLMEECSRDVIRRMPISRKATNILYVDEYLAAMRKRIPLGRPGLASDTANACAFLCSDDAQYMTGEAINVSGGEENH